MRVVRQVYIFIATAGFTFLLSLILLGRPYFKKDTPFFIETDRLILRKFTMRDKKALRKIFSDKEVAFFSLWGPVGRQEVREFLRKTIKSYKKNGYGRLAVISKEDGELIGACGLHRIKIDREKLVAIGCQLAKGYCGKGLGTEVCKAIRDYAFKHFSFDTVLSCIHPYNIASIRVAEKSGMKYLKEGKFLNNHCLVYGITKDEWKVL